MDLRVEYIFKQEMSGDTSFQDKGGFLGTLFPTKYDSTDMRETWHRGIKYGIEIGLRRATLEAQKIDINTNTIKPEHREFLEKFYKLAQEYKCEISYHPEFGMMVLDRNYDK
jgi:hypothetical protein